MTNEQSALDSLLGLDKFEIDRLSHIKIDQARCESCRQMPCLTVCPAGVYKQVQHSIVAAHENCLECGACKIACDADGNAGITWRNPSGGFGVVFRYG